MEWFNTVVALIPLVDAIRSHIATGISLSTLPSLITDPKIVSGFETVGGTLFPQLKPQLHAAAAILTAFSPDWTKWVQNSVNALVPGATLTPDGQYGPMTKAAVVKLQTQLGVPADGWVGDVTSAAIQVALNAAHAK